MVDYLIFAFNVPFPDVIAMDVRAVPEWYDRAKAVHDEMNSE